MGGGNATLGRILLDYGARLVSVLDISSTALELNRTRVGLEAAAKIQYIQADVTSMDFKNANHNAKNHKYDIWHDRAVYHFMTTEQMRQDYVHSCALALPFGGAAVIGTTF